MKIENNNPNQDDQNNDPKEQNNDPKKQGGNNPKLPNNDPDQTPEKEIQDPPVAKPKGIEQNTPEKNKIGFNK